MIRASRDGIGPDARTSRLLYSGPLRGARLLVRHTPQDAVRLAVDQLTAQGFVVRDDGFERRLQGRGSPWTATAVEIGDGRRSNRTFWTGLIADELPFPLPRFLQHGVPPTLVVATARAGADGVTELVVFPHASRRGDPAHAFAAAPRVAAAIEGISRTASHAGALVLHEVLRGIRDDGCPASQQAVRDALEWR